MGLTGVFFGVLCVSRVTQARSSDEMAQRVEDLVLVLAAGLVSAKDRRSLEAKHVALSLNALADRCVCVLGSCSKEAHKV